MTLQLAEAGYYGKILIKILTKLLKVNLLFYLKLSSFVGLIECSQCDGPIFTTTIATRSALRALKHFFLLEIDRHIHTQFYK